MPNEIAGEKDGYGPNYGMGFPWGKENEISDYNQVIENSSGDTKSTKKSLEQPFKDLLRIKKGGYVDSTYANQGGYDDMSIINTPMTTYNIHQNLKEMAMDNPKLEDSPGFQYMDGKVSDMYADSFGSPDVQKEMEEDVEDVLKRGQFEHNINFYRENNGPDVKVDLSKYGPYGDYKSLPPYDHKGLVNDGSGRWIHPLQIKMAREHGLDVIRRLENSGLGYYLDFVTPQLIQVLAEAGTIPTLDDRETIYKLPQMYGHIGQEGKKGGNDLYMNKKTKSAITTPTNELINMDKTEQIMKDVPQLFDRKGNLAYPDKDPAGGAYVPDVDKSKLTDNKPAIDFKDFQSALNNYAKGKPNSGHAANAAALAEFERDPDFVDKYKTGEVRESATDIIPSFNSMLDFHKNENARGYGKCEKSMVKGKCATAYMGTGKAMNNLSRLHDAYRDGDTGKFAHRDTQIQGCTKKEINLKGDMDSTVGVAKAQPSEPVKNDENVKKSAIDWSTILNGE